eukprot:1181872-Prorocentrum_minimum.AAC.2
MPLVCFTFSRVLRRAWRLHLTVKSPTPLSDDVCDDCDTPCGPPRARGVTIVTHAGSFLWILQRASSPRPLPSFASRLTGHQAAEARAAAEGGAAAEVHPEGERVTTQNQYLRERLGIPADEALDLGDFEKKIKVEVNSLRALNSQLEAEVRKKTPPPDPLLTPS